MIAAIYDASGTIVQAVQGTEAMAQATAKAMELAYIEIAPETLGGASVDAYAAAHRVQNNALVAA